jgi:peptidoglycan-associated lipoprotein
MRYPASLGILGAALVAALLALGGCGDKSPKYPNCKGDKDCQEGEVCVDNRCLQCGDDDDCEAGQTCQDGACVAEPACTGDDDCPDGQVCKNQQCVACESDGECGPGGKCEQGACLRPKACNVDEDCADDEDCIDGRCQRPWAGQTPDDVTCELATVYFGFDQAAVPPEARDPLEGNADCIKSADGTPTVQIIGHTDSRGTEEYNIALSERRAAAVADFLARLGIDPARFHVIPMGESEAVGTDEASQAEDRKVEFNWGGRSR